MEFVFPTSHAERIFSSLAAMEDIFFSNLMSSCKPVKEHAFVNEARVESAHPTSTILLSKFIV